MSESDPKTLSLTPEAALAFLELHARQVLALHERRVLVGIAGGPGVGKSTLAVELVQALNAEAPGSSAYVPMDGFHMRHAKLIALGTVADKGAPHTFEGGAFAAFLEQLKAATVDVAGPGYSREIEDVVEDQFVVPGSARILVVEGNYLLLSTAPWWSIRPLLDSAIFIDVLREKVRARLLKRHAEHGLFSEDRNIAHVDRVDLANYDLIRRSRGRADLAIDLDTES